MSEEGVPLGDATSYRAAELVARASYGRLLAHLARRWRDLEGAEDALADAFAAALQTWPHKGVPAEPEAWLLAVARRGLVDAARHAVVRTREDVTETLRQMEERPRGQGTLPDDRVRLMLVCAHPAIDAAVRPALILQVVLGLDVRGMASAFLLSAETLKKRLVRAKAKIRANAIAFDEPSEADLPDRLHALLEAIYAAYFLGREGAVVAGDPRDDLAEEAVYLARVVAAMLPDNAEALGFLALVELCEARRRAQIDAADEFVPLLEQDPRAWDQARLAGALALLERAAARREPGPFQLEAAVQAAHSYRARSGVVPWADIAALYAQLVARWPTIGATVGMAVAVAHAEESPERGIAILENMRPDWVQDYQPWWVALAHLHERRGDPTESRRGLVRALGLTSHPRLRRFLQRRLERQAPET